MNLEYEDIWSCITNLARLTKLTAHIPYELLFCLPLCKVDLFYCIRFLYTLCGGCISIQVMPLTAQNSEKVHLPSTHILPSKKNLLFYFSLSHLNDVIPSVSYLKVHFVDRILGNVCV